MSINGEQTVESVSVRNRSTGEEKTVSASGVFIWIGVNPNSEFVKDKIKLNDWGYIVTDENMQTSVPGVYAIGDVRDTPVRQITTAVGDGTVAAVSALNYIESLET